MHDVGTWQSCYDHRRRRRRAYVIVSAPMHLVTVISQLSPSTPPDPSLSNIGRAATFSSGITTHLPGEDAAKPWEKPIPPPPLAHAKVYRVQCCTYASAVLPQSSAQNPMVVIWAEQPIDRNHGLTQQEDDLYGFNIVVSANFA